MNYKVMIALKYIRAGMVTAGPVNVRLENGAQIVLAEGGMVLGDAEIDRMKHHNVKNVTILTDDPDKIVAPKIVVSLAPKVEPVISDKLVTEALESIQDLFAVASGATVTTAHKVVRQLDDVVDQLVETVTDEVDGLVHIAQLKSHDDYTYHHSLSVAVLSIAIGRALNLDKAELRDLGRAAILHDIGKILIPIRILNKPGKLTNEEFAVVKSHSGKGADYLRKEGIGDRAMWATVRAHHEKVDGTGYPDGLRGGKIPYFARIITVADVYDAITSFRPYRGPMSPSVAFELLVSEVGRAFEHDIVNAFSRAVEFYPVGTVVVLSDERLGVVTNNVSALRPTLQMLDNEEILDLTKLEHLHLMIRRVEDNLASPELIAKVWEVIAGDA